MSLNGDLVTASTTGELLLRLRFGCFLQGKKVSIVLEIGATGLFITQRAQEVIEVDVGRHFRAVHTPAVEESFALVRVLCIRKWIDIVNE
ncbi:hypothetical protein SDC9_169447 [bioreactor metagenome]|uniref:Uncharacterized protein n=1 Tax=bioreactor metagenome TaxID=1076179 RepID=A0A645GDG9_9ZZZZ